MNKIAFILNTFFILNVSGQTVSDTVHIKTHLEKITKTDTFRNYRNVDALNAVAKYIYDNFERSADSVTYQEYEVNGAVYKNVVCSFESDSRAKTIVIGAHYDVCGDQEGADDNASGVAALLEMARLLKDRELNHNIQLVAFTLEEPPFFGTEQMGSYIHAKSLVANNIDVYGMISLEMIGYFSSKENSQMYPIPSLSSIYGSKGDFITLVGKKEKDGFAEKFSTEFKKTADIKTVVFDDSQGLPSIGLSDHINYWKFNFSALMITDTAFLRNVNYHTKYDTIEKLDIYKMARIVDGLVDALMNLN